VAPPDELLPRLLDLRFEDEGLLDAVAVVLDVEFPILAILYEREALRVPVLRGEAVTLKGKVFWSTVRVHSHT
jgi:hypothetical protein